MTQKMNFTNNQNAFEYAIYMMVGSHFKKVNCKSYFQEKKMKVMYAEQKTNTQYVMEDKCIDYLHAKLHRMLPASIWQQEMNVHLIPDENTGTTEIRFVNDRYILRVWGTYLGKKSTLTHELWVRDLAA